MVVGRGSYSQTGCISAMRSPCILRSQDWTFRKFCLLSILLAWPFHNGHQWIKRTRSPTLLKDFPPNAWFFIIFYLYIKVNKLDCHKPLANHNQSLNSTAHNIVATYQWGVSLPQIQISYLTTRLQTSEELLQSKLGDWKSANSETRFMNYCSVYIWVLKASCPFFPFWSKNRTRSDYVSKTWLSANFR